MVVGGCFGVRFVGFAGMIGYSCSCDCCICVNSVGHCNGVGFGGLRLLFGFC